jgi:CBS domain-containing protein
MQASSIIELNGRGIPAVLHTAKIVDVCAYLKSNSTPAALVLSDRGDVRGVMSEADIIGAAGRLGSSVMQMMAGELMREQAPVCQSDTAIVELLEILSETSSDFVLVTEGGVVKGLITFQDVAELLTAALSGGDDETGHAVEADAAVADHAVAGAPAGEAVPRVEMPASEPAPQAEIPARCPCRDPACATATGPDGRCWPDAASTCATCATARVGNCCPAHPTNGRGRSCAVCACARAGCRRARGSTCHAPCARCCSRT